jgi:hypothetical protein
VLEAHDYDMDVEDELDVGLILCYAGLMNQPIQMDAAVTRQKRSGLWRLLSWSSLVFIVLVVGWFGWSYLQEMGRCPGLEPVFR